MSHFEYLQYLIRSWVQTWSCNFQVWADLMTNNYEVYTNPWCESPERECYEWFWAFINMDDTYSKDFLESLYQRMDDIDTGKVRTYPAEDVLKRLKDLVDMEDNNEQL